MSPLKITLVQSSLHWEDIDANLAMFSQKLANISKTDLIVLPEMFSTGFSMKAELLAEEMNGKAIAWMQKTAAEKNAVVTGSLVIRAASIEKDGDMAFFNRLVWMRPDGTYETYDKRHLFSFSGEDTVYTAGSEKLIVELNGWRIRPLICFDLRFPVWSRNTDAEYDLLLYVANWPERRVQAWKYLLIARAIENQAYVVGLNRIGNDGNDIYHSGDSMVIDALGNILYHRQHDEDVVTIELNYDELQKVRNQFQFLKEADNFVINPKSKIVGH
jgi:omega-amidase